MTSSARTIDCRKLRPDLIRTARTTRSVYGTPPVTEYPAEKILHDVTVDGTRAALVGTAPRPSPSCASAYSDATGPGVFPSPGFSFLPHRSARQGIPARRRRCVTYFFTPETATHFGGVPESICPEGHGSVGFGAVEGGPP
jgi:hypothetical protein